MIGLHHQMSYSPAAAAAAAAASTSASLNQSAPDKRGNNSKSNKQVIKQQQQQQQQQLMAKYNYNCEPELVNRWRSPSDARLADGYHEYEHHCDQLDSSRRRGAVAESRGKPPVSGRQQQQQQQQQVVIQVPARTAQPIVVESLIKCNRTSKGLSSRTRRRANSNGDAITATTTTKTDGATYEADEACGWTSGAGRICSEQEQSGRHFLVQQHQRELLAHQNNQTVADNNNQVLLIMSDNHETGAGVPFIGRRLPDKSFGTSSSSRQPPPPQQHSSALVGCQAPHGHRQQPQQPHQGPVIGRRSHRISSIHNRQQPLHSADQLAPIGPLPISAHLHQDAHQLHRRAQGHAQATAKCPSLSVLDAIAAEGPPYVVVGQQQQALTRQHGRKSGGMRLMRRDNKLAPSLQSSNSCSSLVSSTVAEQSAPVCQDACCQRRGRRQRQPTQVPSSGVPPPQPVELMRCKSKLVSSSSNNLPLLLTTPSESQCLLPCCYAAAPAPPPQDYVHDLMDSSQLGPAGAGAHHYHDTCQANGHSFGGEPIHGGGANYQPHARHQRKHQLVNSQQRRRTTAAAADQSQLHHRHQHEQHQRLAPPVPIKPIVSPSYQQQQQQRFNSATDSAIMDENEHVTQMYESLAAELKAKLGNPNRAPILLPPKDYDTLSRQQGKLTGIELRRSTNPQLIGPQVRRSSSSSNAATTATTTTTSSMQSSPPVPINSVKYNSGDADEGSALRSSANKRTTPSGGALLSSIKSSPCSSPRQDTDHRKLQQRADTSLSTSSLSPATVDSSSSSSGGGHQHDDDEAGSARSSGRGSQATTSELIHHHDSAARSDSLQRSRSNSSSGLGSISLGGRSPDSAHLCSSSSPASKSSSSEDMRHHHHHEASDDNRHEQQHRYEEMDERRGKGIENHNPSKVSGGVLWNGRVEVPLKVNSKRLNGNTYLATKQIIY